MAARSSRKLSSLLSLTVCGASLLWQSAALAQVAGLPAPASATGPNALVLGDFRVTSQAQAGLTHSSNIRLDASEQADNKAVVSLGGNAESTWQRHHLAASVSAFAQDVQERRHDDLDNETLSGSLQGRFELGGGAIVRGALQRQQSLIGKNHVDQLNGLLHGTSTTDLGSYGLEWDSPRWFLSATGQQARMHNESDVATAGKAEVQALDRTERQATLQVGRHLSQGNVYGFVGTQAIDYDAAPGLALQERDSRGWRAGAGSQFRFGKWQGALSAIRFTQNFDGAAIRDQHAVVGTLQLNYPLRDTLTLSSLLQRSFAETSIDGIAGIYTRTLFLGLVQSFSPQWYVKAGPAWHRDQLASSSMATRRTSWEAQTVWQWHPRAALVLDLSWTRQRASDARLLAQQFKETSASLSLQLRY